MLSTCNRFSLSPPGTPARRGIQRLQQHLVEIDQARARVAAGTCPRPARRGPAAPRRFGASGSLRRRRAPPDPSEVDSLLRDACTLATRGQEALASDPATARTLFRRASPWRPTCPRPRTDSGAVDPIRPRTCERSRMVITFACSGMAPRRTGSDGSSGWSASAAGSVACGGRRDARRVERHWSSGLPAAAGVLATPSSPVAGRLSHGPARWRDHPGPPRRPRRPRRDSGSGSYPDLDAARGSLGSACRPQAGGGPRSGPDDGTPVETLREEASDRGLEEDHVYHYGIHALYRNPQGQVLAARGVTVLAAQPHARDTGRGVDIDPPGRRTAPAQLEAAHHGVELRSSGSRSRPWTWLPEPGSPGNERSVWKGTDRGVRFRSRFRYPAARAGAFLLLPVQRAGGQGDRGSGRRLRQPGRSDRPPGGPGGGIGQVTFRWRWGTPGETPPLGRRGLRPVRTIPRRRLRFTVSESEYSRPAPTR